MTGKISLGRFIADRRKFRQLSQEELAKLVGVSKSAIAKWETDRGLPDRDNLKRLSEVLYISVDDLHKIIKSASFDAADLDVNITPDVIAVLESYGYKVVKPEEKEDM